MIRTQHKQRWGLLIGCILLCEAAGIIGSIFTFAAIPTWYQSLTKPMFTPPNSIFGPVWTTLYLFMGVSLYLVITETAKQRADQKPMAYLVFGVQLFLNTIWSIVFFGGQSLVGGLIVIGLLWVSIAATIGIFYRISKPAGWLLFPYLFWVSFASVLNYSLYSLNP